MYTWFCCFKLDNSNNGKGNHNKLRLKNNYRDNDKGNKGNKGNRIQSMQYFVVVLIYLFIFYFHSMICILWMYILNAINNKLKRNNDSSLNRKPRGGKARSSSSNKRKLVNKSKKNKGMLLFNINVDFSLIFFDFSFVVYLYLSFLFMTFFVVILCLEIIIIPQHPQKFLNTH